ncbi:MAG TPA: SMC family ATPase, partial [Longimicrobiales bacterium]|nr:SMC family ATPase [Longimicrobiales bacterium]
MKLVRLELENFRQHAATTLHFPEGLTGIIGPNGAGKSTLLEAVGWCLYGAGAARGTNETIRFTKAPGGGRVRAELVFEMDGHEFRVVRSLTAADVFLDGEPTPVATTIGGVTDYLRRQLAMTREEFFNTYFTGQKELQFLAQLGPAQRARFLNQVLGYERLRAAQDRVRARRSELRHETLGLKAGLPDPEKLEEERERAQAALAEAEGVRAAAADALRAAEARLAEVRPRWERAQADRERDRELLHGAEMAARELEAAERELAGVEAELARIAAAETELAPLRSRLAELPTVQAECERLASLARAAERRRGLEVTEGQLAADVAQEAARLEALATAPEYLERTQEEARTHEAAVAAAEGELRVLNDAWVQRRQEIETKLRTYHDSYRELKAKIEQLREAGPQGTCPTCERPLEDHFDTVVSALEDERFRMTQDGKWLRQRAEQLEEKSDELRAAEARRAALAEEGQRLARKLTRCETAVQEQSRLQPEHARRETRLAEVRAELAALSTGYDAERHRAAEARLGELRAVDTQAGGLARLLEARPERARQRAEALERVGRA